MRFRQVHLDFHTGEKVGGIGARFDKKQFQEALKAGHVDSITVFAKCHHGWSYHPSKVGPAHPALTCNLLGEQIAAAHEIGVKTPVYLSAGLDEQMVYQHPEWCSIDKYFNLVRYDWVGYRPFCFNTPYMDYLMDQVREVVENYDADGIFLDIVGVRPCRCFACVKEMFRRGMDPENDADVMQLAEEVYARYLRRVRETVDSVKPDLPVFQNCGHLRAGRLDLLHGQEHLELESLPTGGWGYDHFPFTAAYAQTLGMPFLGMTGKFHTNWGEFGGYKHPNALRYETALSVAFGAGCSVGDQLSPDGEMDGRTYDIIGAAYAEIEEKEPWLTDSEAVADVAVLSTEGYYNHLIKNSSAGISLTKADTGAGRILLEGKYLFQVVDCHTELAPYKVLVLPDCIRVDEDLAAKLHAFVQGGGKLLASGKSGLYATRDEFAFDLGARFEAEGEFTPSYIRPAFDNPYNTDFIMYQPHCKVSAVGIEHAAAIAPYFNRTREHFCSHQHTPSSKQYYGAGITEGADGIYIAWNIFEDYATKGELIAKQTVLFALDRLLGEDKTITTTLGSVGVATLRRQPNRRVMHLLYAAPVKRGENIEVIEDISEQHNVSCTVKTEKAPARVYLAPQREEIPFAYEAGRVTFTVPRMECHQMVVLEDM
ncbi:MAG: beta-galactosidase [Ruminococcaceae bacterium]|nr:beta-galactosidase [Oscillospiraceae bacterium]